MGRQLGGEPYRSPGGYRTRPTRVCCRTRFKPGLPYLSRLKKNRITETSGGIQGVGDLGATDLPLIVGSVSPHAAKQSACSSRLTDSGPR